MGYKQVGSQNFDSEIFKFEREGDMLEGVLVALRNATTKMGLATLADIDVGIGEHAKKYSIFVTAGLATRLTEDLVGEKVLIEYQGEQKNPKTGRMFKAYNVCVWEEDEDDHPAKKAPKGKRPVEQPADEDQIHF